MSLSLKDIAEKCGCSSAVVSSVLNNKQNGTTRCSIDKAREIRRVAAECNYKVSKPRGHSSRVLHFLTLFSELQSSPKPEHIALNVLSSALIEENVSINTISIEDPDLETKIKSLDESFEQSFFVLLHFHHKSAMSVLDGFKGPKIFINPSRTFPNNCILPDDAQGCEQALKLLKSYNVKRVLYIDNKGNSHQSNRLRQAGFVDKCPEYGMEVVKTLDIGAIKEDPILLKNVNEISDVIVSYENRTTFLTSILKCFGLKVPDDIGILSLGGHDFSDMSTPSTYVDIPFIRMGEIAASMLLKMIYTNKYEFNNIIVPEHLVIGETLSPIQN